ncbi:hypothetical protein [Neorhizobium sp. T25_27]|uniref:hypothetical protein n=1 Tax=Neorhizobium sp. T25_27 TaxID=2093831 RepID=UPI000CF93B75|nr:hypothetical protein [Neorhizobium sp. T25_27]
MRFLIAAAVGSVAITGTFGAYTALSPVTQDNDFSDRYLQLARNAPDLLARVIAATLPNCLTEAARGPLNDAMVGGLATKTYFKSGIFMAEGKSAEQSADEFIPWITKQAEPLNAAQREAYLTLINGELTSPNVVLCVNSAIKSAITEKIDLKAGVWNLRT